MSKYEFKLPDVGEGVTEGEIVKWLVKLGDAVGEDEPIVEVMTDKATVTITSPKRGTVIAMAGAEGAIVAVGATLLALELGDGTAEARPGQVASASDVAGVVGASAVAAASEAAKKSDGPAATAVGDIRESLPGMELLNASATVAVLAEAPSAGYFNAKPLATPATRKLAREHGVDLRAVLPTGTHGRVLSEDVRRAVAVVGGAVAGGAVAGGAVAGGAVAGGAVAGGAVAGSLPEKRPPIIVSAPTAEQQQRESRRPLKGVRKRIFDAMARATQTAAHFTFVEECDVTGLKAIRERMRGPAQERGVKLTFLPFFVKAVVLALKRHPALNSAFDESTSEIVERRYYNIGIASATEQGLMVPVVHDADKKSLLEIAADIQRLGEATKIGKVAAEDLRGSTFTITSLGQQGGLFATPILNMPEVGILGLHQMKQKPVVRAGEIVIGDVMLLSLSFDHRLIDGHIGAAFAYDIIAYIENPDRLWLEMS
ncbi:MAG: 2-oxo acid dehydrogenase subunit E2 [Myxococcales bacterium]|nr:2-oxo acid dehydrogenase subunit E2 [Myxococcales bacterium]